MYVQIFEVNNFWLNTEILLRS